MTIASKVSIIAVGTAFASATGAVVGYSTSNNNLMPKNTKIPEKKESKFSDPLVWASFKNKFPSTSNNKDNVFSDGLYY